jgi:hypothetical protein
MLHLIPSYSLEVVHLERIITTYPYMTSHPSDLMHHRLGGKCMETTSHRLQ